RSGARAWHPMRLSHASSGATHSSRASHKRSATVSVSVRRQWRRCAGFRATLWLESRLLVDLLQRLLADARFILLVHREKRLLELSLFVGRQLDDLALAGFTDQLDGFVVVLLGDFVGVFGRVFHHALELRADVRRQAVPELLVADDGVTDVPVVADHGVFLDLVHL